MIARYSAGVSSIADAAPRKPVTLGDVARRAGVSQPTASRVLNGSERQVNEEYRQRVLLAAQELGYTPNLSAQAVARGSSRTIALVLSGISDPYFSAMAAALMWEAEGLGLHASIAVTDRRVDRELDLVRALRGQQPRAIILAGTGYLAPASNDELIEELHRYEETGGRVVLISRSDLPFETVTFDNHDGASRLAGELVALGYRRALVLGTLSPLLAMQQRVDGFVAGFVARGAAEPTVLRPVFSWEGCFDAVKQLDEQTLRDHDVLFAVTDDMALGAVAGLRERGLRIPDDIAVAGFDDIATLRDVSPSLTTVHVPLDEVAREAVYRATTTDSQPRRQVVPTYPVMRASTPSLRHD